jgi:hypothetical protein
MYTRTILELEEKVKRQELRFGTDHPKLLETLGQLSHTYFVFGRYDDVERLLWRSVTICSKWYGPEHISLTAFLADIGYLYEMQEHWVEAEHVYRLAYAIKASYYGHAHGEALLLARNIVRVCRAQDKHLPERELEKLSSMHMTGLESADNRGT